MEVRERVALLCAVLVLFGALVPATTPLLDRLDAGQGGERHETGAATGGTDQGGSSAAPLFPSALQDPMLASLLGDPTGGGDGVGGLVDQLTRTRTDPALDPVHLLEQARDRFGQGPQSFDPVPESATLTEAIARYAQVRDLDPLTPEERRAVELLPPLLSEDLTPLIDALAYASEQQRAATEELTRQEARQLVRLSTERANPATELTTHEARRLDAMRSKVDLARMTHGAAVLTRATIDARESLASHVDAGLLDHLEPQPPVGGPAPTDDAERTTRGLSYAARVLASRTPGAQDGLDRAFTPSHDLASAVKALRSAVLPGAPSTGESAPGLEDRFPDDLDGALAGIVLAHATALDGTEAAGSAPEAVSVLDATARAMPVLETWSHLLEHTPPDAHFYTPDERTDRAAGLALETPERARSLEGALEIAAYQGGVQAPASTPALDPPDASQALLTWYDAFDRSPEDAQAAADALEDLPEQARDALTLLLHGQVRAQELVGQTHLPPDATRTLSETAPAVQSLLSGAPPTPERLDALDTLRSIADAHPEEALAAGLLLAQAMDEAQRLLDELPEAEPPSHDPTRDAPDRPDPSAPAAPRAPVDPPDTPYSHPGRDIWFEDPTGLILMTGYEGTEAPDAFTAMRVDLGGDDVHTGNAGGVTDTDPIPFALLLELGGDDTYRTDTPYAQGAAATLTSQGFPIGILADHEGDDTYEAGPISQGANLDGGLGILYDVDGDDAYTVTGTLPSPPAGFPTEGGQGYTVHTGGPSRPLEPPGLGLLTDLAGSDTYTAENGQGSAIAIGDDPTATTTVRSATGLLIEASGTDRYDCDRVCLGTGRFASTESLDCRPGDRGCGLARTGDGPPQRHPGVLSATGTILELGGHDTYPLDRGQNNRILPHADGMRSDPEAGLAGVETRVGVRVNVTVFVDLGLADTNGDLVPDHVAAWLGYDPTAPDEGPLRSPIETLRPVDLLAGSDSDGDGYSDALERRLGTDPQDNRSAPAKPTGLLDGRSNKLLDLRLDLTTGSVLTDQRRASIKLAGAERAGYDGTGSDDTRIGLIGIGDSTRTLWNASYIVTIDLGGHDDYTNNAGATMLPLAQTRPVGDAGLPLLSAIALDLDGDDRYTAPDGLPAQGAGLSGSYGLLVDAHGKDTYTADRVAQAAALGPGATGALVDLDGNDTYTAKQAAQGQAAATCEAMNRRFQDVPCDGSGSVSALLLDHAGADTYEGPGQGRLEPRGALGPSIGTSTLIPNYYPGAHGDTPNGGVPYPNGFLAGPSGDSALAADLAGPDEYRFRGSLDPMRVQGFVADPRPPGHSLAGFVDADGADRYVHLLRDGNVQRFDKDNRVLVRGVPYTDNSTRGTSIFLDAGPYDTSPEGFTYPAILESLAGARHAPRDQTAERNETDGNETHPRDDEGIGYPDRTGDRALNLPRLGIVVGTNGANRYDQAHPLIVDLGGSDWYRGPVGAGVGEVYSDEHIPFGVGLTLDLAGNDRYEHEVVDDGIPTPAITHGTSFGAGLLGIGVLADHGGFNTFNTTVQARWSSLEPSLGLTQGAGLEGVGVLLVSQAESTFNTTLLTDAPQGAPPPSLGLAQGAALAGTGILATPGQGADTYRITVEPPGHLRGAGQGYAAEGLGALIEGGGDDRFNATGAAQGVATTLIAPGMQEANAAPRAPGSNNALIEPRDWGIGVLASTGPGDTTYRATGLAQGAAWGMDRYGLLLDAHGQDTYVLTPQRETKLPGLGQGAGLPGGTGILLDQHGDDAYTAHANPEGNESAAQGISWNLLTRNTNVQFGATIDGLGRDPAMGVLADLQGHDTYTAAQGAQGASNHQTGTGILVDRAGDDAYHATDRAQGYGELGGAGVFLDASGADRYIPLIHTSAGVNVCQTGPCTETGEGNDIAWLGGLGGVGADAPTMGLAQAALDEANAAGVPEGLRIELEVLEPDPFAPDSCSDTLADLSQIHDGELCLRATVKEPRSPDGLRGPPLSVDRIRLLALHPDAPPALIHATPGPNRTVTVPWDTSQAAYLDGTLNVRASAQLSLEDEQAGEPWMTRDTFAVENETQLEIDNPPVVRIDAPAWVNPSITDPVDVTVRILGEAPGTDILVQGLSIPSLDPADPTPCWSKTVQEQHAIPQTAQLTLSFEADLSACTTQGPHVVNVDALDTDGQYASEAQPRSTITIDTTGPRTTIEAPDHINRTRGSSGGFTVQWNTTDEHSPVDRVDLAVDRGGERIAWLSGQPPNGTAVWEGFSDGETLRFEATAIDAAGNERRGSGSSVEVDLTPPRVQDPRVTPRYVRSGDPVTFSVNASDTGGLEDTTVVIDGEPFRLRGGLAAGEQLQTLSYSGWASESSRLAAEHGLNASRPEGYAFSFQITDRAGNTAQTLEQQVFIDDIPPRIEDARLAYPNGAAGGPGDLVRLTVQASDNLELDAPATADTASVSTNGDIALREDPATGNLTGVFLLDRTDDPANATVTITLRDAAGNTNRTTLPVELATTAPRVLALRAQHTTTNSTQLAWRTNVDSTAEIELTDPLRGRRVTLTPHALGTQHTLNVTGLDPATRYVGTLVPANAAGGTGEAHPFTVTTESAIGLDITHPGPGALVAGTLDVSWLATHPTADELAHTIRLVSTDPLAPADVPLDTIVRETGRTQRATMDVTRVPDGAYELRLEASHGSDRNHTTLANVTVDNTAPVTRLLDPEPGSLVGPGPRTLRAAVVDPLSGVDDTNVTFTLGDRTLRATAAPDGTFTATANLTTEGTTELWITASDDAGNTARDGGPLFVDPTAPQGASIHIDAPDDQTHAKPGDTIRLVLTTPEPEPTLHAELAQIPVLGDHPRTFETGARAHTLDLTVPANATAGDHDLTVTVRDRAGNTRVHELTLTIDDRPPTIEDPNVITATPTSATLEVCATEPVTLAIEAHAPGADPLARTLDARATCQQPVLQGLTPGRTYETTITARDGAGHQADATLEIQTPTDEIPPRAPERLREASAGEGALTLAWEPAIDDIGVDRYRVLRATGEDERLEPLAETASTRYTDHTVLPGRAYRYAVEPIDLAGNQGQPTDPITLTAVGAPELTNATVTPERGHAATTFTYTVTYAGPVHGDLDVRVIVDGTPHPMTLTGDPEDCLRACTFTYTTQLDPQTLGQGGHTYRFTAHADGFTSQAPPQQDQLNGPIVTNHATEQGTSSQVVAGVAIAATGLLAGAVAAIRRFGGGGA